MIASYKSVVVFRDLPGPFEAEREFQEISFIKFFHTANFDEVSQITAQSDQTIIFIFDPRSAGPLAKVRPLRTKIYFLDQLGISDPETQNSLSLLGIATLKLPEVKELAAKISLVFLGKVSLDKIPSFSAYDHGKNEAQQTYFSHFEFVEENWLLVVSTHERDPEIENRFSQSWSLYLMKILSRASKIFSPEENPGFSSVYHEILYPHRNTKIPKLSIIHLRKDPVSFDSLRTKALIFLQNLDR